MNNIKELESKLTPAAKEYYNELINEFKAEIFQTSVEQSISSDVKFIEISLNDLVNRKKIEKIQKHYESRKNRINKLMFFMGIFYAFAGSSIYIIQNINFDISKDLGIIITLMGIGIALFSYFFSIFSSKFFSSSFRKIKSSNDFSKYTVVEEWNKIENYIRKKLSKEKSVEESDIPIRVVVNYLIENYTDSEKDVKRLKQMISTRNSIVHGNTGISREGLDDYKQFFDYLNWQIKEKDRK